MRSKYRGQYPHLSHRSDGRTVRWQDHLPVRDHGADAGPGVSSLSASPRQPPWCWERASACVTFRPASSVGVEEGILRPL